jgi:hypothetical protein
VIVIFRPRRVSASGLTGIRAMKMMSVYLTHAGRQTTSFQILARMTGRINFFLEDSFYRRIFAIDVLPSFLKKLRRTNPPSLETTADEENQKNMKTITSYPLYCSEYCVGGAERNFFTRNLVKSKQISTCQHGYPQPGREFFF